MKLRILVDDEVEFITTLSERLSMRNYDTRIATSVVEAMPLIYSYSPQLVILDIKMILKCQKLEELNFLS